MAGTRQQAIQEVANLWASYWLSESQTVEYQESAA